MRKNDKKIENTLRIALTTVCEEALEQIQGYQYLSHQVNYQTFPRSLLITAVFDNADNLKIAQESNQLASLINHALLTIGIKLTPLAAHLTFKTK